VLKEHVGTMTFAEIGALLGRTDKSVKARALHLSLRGGPKPRLPKQKDHMRKCHDCGKPTPDYRCPACWRKLRRRLGCPVEEEPINE
jgi:rRNA maturation endonuclease Nob1